MVRSGLEPSRIWNSDAIQLHYTAARTVADHFGMLRSFGLELRDRDDFRGLRESNPCPMAEVEFESGALTITPRPQ